MKNTAGGDEKAHREEEQTEIFMVPVTVCHNRLVEAASVCLPLTEHGRWRGGSYGEAQNDGSGVRNEEERARNAATREAMKPSTEKIRDMRGKKKRRLKREKGGGISFVTPETERCQRARPLIDAPPISACQASFFFFFSPAG